MVLDVIVLYYSQLVMFDYLEHVHPVTLDLGVESVEVNVPDHLGGDGRLEPTVAPQTDEHVLQWVGRVVPHLRQDRVRGGHE